MSEVLKPLLYIKTPKKSDILGEKKSERMEANEEQILTCNHKRNQTQSIKISCHTSYPSAFCIGNWEGEIIIKKTKQSRVTKVNDSVWAV